MAELQQQDITVPTIFLSGSDAETAKVQGLDLGGDDTITKPFSTAELIARIRAVLRRSEQRDHRKVTKNTRVTEAPFEFCGAKVVPGRLQISFSGGVVESIGRKELGILHFLDQHRGEVITRKALIHAVWGVHADVRSRSLDQYIVKVRNLFKRHGRTIGAFRAVHGVGYIFDPAGLSNEGE